MKASDLVAQAPNREPRMVHPDQIQATLSNLQSKGFLLKRAGYATQGVGKWHVGENNPNLPQNVGYDDYYGFLSVSEMYTEWRDQYYNPVLARVYESFGRGLFTPTPPDRARSRAA